MSNPVPLNSRHKQKIIGQVKKGFSKQEVLEEFFPLVSNKQKLVQFIAQVPSAYMRSRFKVLNIVLAALLGFMLFINLASENYLGIALCGLLLYWVLTFKTYYYHWIIFLAFFGMIPVAVMLVVAIIHHVEPVFLYIFGVGLAIGTAIMVMGSILSSRLATKYTARYVEKTNAQGRTYKTFEYIFIEEKKSSDLLDNSL